MAIKSLTVHVTPQNCSWQTGYALVKDIINDVGNSDYEVHIEVADVSHNRDMKTSNVFNGGAVHNQYNNNYVSMS